MQDEWHTELGADAPHANRVAWLNQAVGNCGDGDGLGDKDGAGEGVFGRAMAMAMGRFQLGVGWLSSHAAQGGVGAEGMGMNGFRDFDQNFLDGGSGAAAAKDRSHCTRACTARCMPSTRRARQRTRSCVSSGGATASGSGR